MILSLRACSSKIVSALPARAAARPLSTTPVCHVKLALKPSQYAQTPMELLTLIGRNADKRLESKADSWESLTQVYQQGTSVMEEAGLSVQERRYIISALHKYSQGWKPRDFVRSVRPPKKFRGWGPAIQHGVRVKGKGAKRTR